MTSIQEQKEPDVILDERFFSSFYDALFFPSSLSVYTLRAHEKNEVLRF